MLAARMRRRPKAVWSDFGGVLPPPVTETLLAFCGRVGAAPDELLPAMFAVAESYGSEDVMEPLDTPLLSEEEWARRVEEILYERFGVRADLSNFAEKWFADRPPNAAMVAYLRTLKERGWFVGMLSNMVPSFEPHWRVMV